MMMVLVPVKGIEVQIAATDIVIDLERNDFPCRCQPDCSALKVNWKASVGFQYAAYHEWPWHAICEALKKAIDISVFTAENTGL